MSLTLALRRPVLADLIACLSTRVASGLTTSACQRQQWALGCKWDIGAKRWCCGTGTSPRWWRTGNWKSWLCALRAVLTNGLGRDEMKEILLQTAICGGVFSTSTAFESAQQVFREMDTSQ